MRTGRKRRGKEDGKGEAICRDERKKRCNSREKVNVGTRTDHLDGKETKEAEGADVMSLRKVTRKGQTRGKAIREYRRKKQQRKGGRESNRKIEIPSAGCFLSPRHISRGYEISPCFIKRIGFRESFYRDDEY